MFKNISWALVILFSLVILMKGFPRYQVATYGNSGAIIIDCKTGEAWRTKEVFTDFIQLQQVSYGCQYEGAMDYTPEHSRNSQHKNYFTRLKKLFGDLLNEKKEEDVSLKWIIKRAPKDQLNS